MTMGIISGLMALYLGVKIVGPAVMAAISLATWFYVNKKAAEYVFGKPA